MALQPRIIACGNSIAAFAMAVRFLMGPAVMAVASIAVGLRGVLLRIAIVQVTKTKSPLWIQVLFEIKEKRRYWSVRDFLSMMDFFFPLVSMMKCGIEQNLKDAMEIPWSMAPTNRGSTFV